MLTGACAQLWSLQLKGKRGGAQSEVYVDVAVAMSFTSLLAIKYRIRQAGRRAHMTTADQGQGQGQTRLWLNCRPCTLEVGRAEEWAWHGQGMGRA